MSIDDVRAGVLGPEGSRLVVIEGGRGRGRRKPPVKADDDCPITVLGHAAGEWYFLDARGQQRKLTSRQLGSRTDLASLFLGDMEWVKRRFPKTKTVAVKGDDGEIAEQTLTIGIRIADAAEHLMQLAGQAGLYGPHVTLRHPGVWPAEHGTIVHCGDEVRIDGAWRRAGFRAGDHLWPLAAKTSRPALHAALPAVARDIQQRMQDLWSWAQAGGAIAALGLVGVGYYGAAAPWRSNGFVTGEGGSGKSSLLTLLTALAPLHHYTNDTTKAALEQDLNGRAMQIFVDEASDRVDQHGAEKLLDLVLSSSGGEGTRGSRGSASGVSRSISVISSVVMASVIPPDMKPQHRQRFTMLLLHKPAAGEDNRAEHDALIAHARSVAAALWARALDGYARNVAALAAFRTALGEVGCDAREMDQLGAILAAWWVLTEDGVPDARAARAGVAALSEFVRGAAAAGRDSGSRRLIDFLASTTVQRDRSTDIEQIGVLAALAWSTDPVDQHSDGFDVPPPSRVAYRLLCRYGIRVVRADDVSDSRGRPVPRGSEGDGMWFGNRAESLRRLFRGSAFEGEGWLHQLIRLETARPSKASVRIAGYAGACIWISRKDWDEDTC